MNAPDHQVERRLAAILAADVAGYSRLVGADEEGTLRRWWAHWREFVEPGIKEHGGRIVRIAGDGILAEFASVVAAVRCALAFQLGMMQRNAHVPSGERIEFRIGVNVGDVIIDRGDIWGTGVNLAARLEALAEPGGICVSGRVHDDVHGKLGLVFEDMGRQKLKNIAQRVRVYRAGRDAIAKSLPALPAGAAGSLAAGSGITELANQPAAASFNWTLRRVLLALALVGLASSAIAPSWWLTTSAAPRVFSLAGSLFNAEEALKVSPPGFGAPLSIVVLPFVNLSGDAGEDYLADGIADSLTSDLSRALPGSFVVSRGTAFTYKGRDASPRQIGRELEVRYLLSGSVIPAGERVRVNTHLVDTKDGRQLWSERFDTELRSILEVQDEIVARLSRAIGLKVVDIEAQRSERYRPASSEVVDLVMRAKALLNRPSSPATMTGSRELFEKVLHAQPTNVDALAGVATTLVFEFLNGYYETGGDERLHRAEALLDRALSAEPRHLMGLKAKSALLRASGRFDDAMAAAAAVIAENPGEPWAYKEIGLSTMYLGRPEEALDWFAKADRIGPRDPGRWTWLDGRGQALMLLGRDGEATASLRGALEANPRNRQSYALLAAAYALSERSGEAQSALAQYDQAHAGTRVSTFRVRAPVPLALTSPAYRQQRQRIEDGLRKAGMPE